jgi:cysteinyl-tRNA synthetase
LFALVRESNTALQRNDLTPPDAAAALAVFDAMDSVLGVVRFGRASADEGLPPEVAALVEARAQARAGKDWEGSDRIRNELAAMGGEVRDSKEGQKVKRL